MIKHEYNLIMIDDENGVDVVGDYLSKLNDESNYSEEAKLHLMFIQSAFNLLSVQPLDKLIDDYTELSITLNNEVRTKRYELIKPLRVSPIHELRYAMNGNDHLRFLFFPFDFKGQKNYVFVKVFKKTRVPRVDETNIMRDLTHKMYEKVKLNPEHYLSDLDEIEGVD